MLAGVAEGVPGEGGGEVEGVAIGVVEEERNGGRAAEPKPYVRNTQALPKLGRFTGVSDQILADDERAPAKQRHLATQIFSRLVQEHGYAGGYDSVRRYVQKHRRRRQELFVPLVHEPGQRAECDFGHIHVDFPEGRRLVPVLIAELVNLAKETRWPHRESTNRWEFVGHESAARARVRRKWRGSTG